ncbi:hypothetical protein BDN72DRAFT_881578 [Pluteus cervinus]|uniref:Uncharacterized protein n=1 Tax=Pluteus cervinus TaxID=181527 RepID=A0ACD3AF80_9AGAR|nr:hypothetical protein BDN72DRAFT_881578 [Pluteus cervinus]
MSTSWLTRTPPSSIRSLLRLSTKPHHIPKSSSQLQAIFNGLGPTYNIAPRLSNSFSKPDTILKRHFSSSPNPYTSSSSSSFSFNAQSNNVISPSRYIDALESTARAPWLWIIPPEDEEKLKRAHSLLFQTIMYLNRPLEGDKGARNRAWLAFDFFPVPATSEVARARRAIASITQVIIKNISSIPMNSPLRTKHQKIFEIFGTLEVLGKTYLDNWGGGMFVTEPMWMSESESESESMGSNSSVHVNADAKGKWKSMDAKGNGKGKRNGKGKGGEVKTKVGGKTNDLKQAKEHMGSIWKNAEQWSEFWEKAKPVFPGLCIKLNRAGFGYEKAKGWFGGWLAGLMNR